MKVKDLAQRAIFSMRKKSPELLVISGVVGVVATVVLACKATTKAGAILEETKKDLEGVRKCREDEILSERYSEEDAKKDTVVIYTKMTIKMIKLYGIPALVGAASIVSILASHKILKGRNVALAGAYAALDKSFKEYRSEVVGRFGEEVDKELRYKIREKEIEETFTDENGNQVTKKKTVKVSNGLPSVYAKVFDESCKAWVKDAEMNLNFLRVQQDIANNRLQAEHFLFLNDVYDMLGIPRTKAGQHVGWIYDLKNPRGDNYVDFGIYDICNQKKCDFINGYERSIILDFNVDGDILSDFEKHMNI